VQSSRDDLTRTRWRATITRRLCGEEAGVKTAKYLAGPLAVVLSVMASATVAVQEQTASDFYMSYRKALEKAQSVEEIMPLMATATRAKIEGTAKEDRANMFEFVKKMSKMSSVKVVKETKTADGVTLTVEGVQDKETRVGQIQIVKEDGAWKMGRESWSSKS
jgi:hypothetical protein